MDVFEDSLNLRQDQLELIVQKSPVSMLVIGSRGNIEYINQKFTELFGWTQAALQNQEHWCHSLFPDLDACRENPYCLTDSGVLDAQDSALLKLKSASGAIKHVKVNVTNISRQLLLITVEDVTRQQEDQMLLEDSEQRYRILAEHVTDMISRHDVAGNYLYVSPACKTLLGYEAQEVVGHNAYEFFHPEDLATIRASHQAIVELPESYTVTYRIRRKDNQYIWFETVSKTVREEANGAVREIIAVSRDITDRKKAEEILSQSEHLYRSLFETMELGVVYQDSVGKIIGNNPAAERILGLTSDQMRGLSSIDKNWRAIHEDGSDYPGEDHPAMLALRTGKPVKNAVMGVYNPKKKQTNWILVNATPEYSPGESKPFQVYATFSDITELKQKEEEVRLLNEQLELRVAQRTIELLQTNEELQREISERTLTEKILRQTEWRLTEAQRIARLGSWEWDIDNNTLVWSDEVYQIFGVNKDRFMPSLEKFNDAIFADDVETVNNAVQKALDTGSRYSIAHRIVKPNGEIRFVHEDAEPKYDAQGKVVTGLVGTVQDITERTKVELELRKALGDLQHTQIQLVQAEKMASLGILTAGIAHEINNPINFIGSGTSALRKKLTGIVKVLEKYKSLVDQQAGPVPDALQQKLDYSSLVTAVEDLLVNIETGVSRTADIVKGLRKFARKDVEEMTFCDVHEAIDTGLMLLRNQYQGKIRIDKHYANIPRFRCYQGALNQVFMNLLSNAIDSIFEKNTQTDNEAISVTTALREAGREKWVDVSISDTGMGFSSEALAKLFDPFYTTKEVGKGTGLGLAITLGIIEKHEGKITARNNSESGATFEISIPFRS